MQAQAVVGGSSAQLVALGGVQERSDELRGLNTDLRFLAGAFVDLQTMVVEQGEALGDVENSVARTKQQQQRTNTQLDVALRNANAARRKMVYIVLILAAVVGAIALFIFIVYRLNNPRPAPPPPHPAEP